MEYPDEINHIADPMEQSVKKENYYYEQLRRKFLEPDLTPLAYDLSDKLEDLGLDKALVAYLREIILDPNILFKEGVVKPLNVFLDLARDDYNKALTVQMMQFLMNMTPLFQPTEKKPLAFLSDAATSALDGVAKEGRYDLVLKSPLPVKPDLRKLCVQLTDGELQYVVRDETTTHHGTINQADLASVAFGVSIPEDLVEPIDPKLEKCILDIALTRDHIQEGDYQGLSDLLKRLRTDEALQEQFTTMPV